MMKKSLLFIPAMLLALLLINSCVTKARSSGENIMSADSTDVAALGGNEPAESNIIFKSIDGGQTWQNISEGLPEPGTDDNGVSKIDFFAAADELWLTAGNEIYHNNGKAATPFWNKEISEGQHSRIAPGRDGIYAYQHGGRGVLHKTNGTEAWSPVFTNFQEKRIFSVFETAGGSIFIGSERGLFKSNNSGKSWKQLPLGGGVKIVESNGVLLATSGAGILRSTDDGENWAVVIGEGGVGIDVARIEGGFAAIHYSTPAKARRIRTSYDGGKTWQAIDAGLLQANGFIDPILPPVNAKAQSFSDSTRHAAATEVPAEPTYITTIIQVGEDFFCGRSDGIYKSSNKGKTWQCVRCVNQGKMFKLYVSGNTIYALQVASHC